VNGLMLGVLAYSTYELTNMATLANWSWKMVILDTTWGGILTAITCFVGYRAYSKLNKTVEEGLIMKLDDYQKQAASFFLGRWGCHI
jgi:hypothetical protein